VEQNVLKNNQEVFDKNLNKIEEDILKREINYEKVNLVYITGVKL